MIGKNHGDWQCGTAGNARYLSLSAEKKNDYGGEMIIVISGIPLLYVFAC